MDAVVDDFYTDGVGRFWPPERRLVDSGYREIDFPFREVTAPQIDMTADWNRAQFLGYIATWSAVKAAEKQGLDPLPAFTEAIKALWPDESQFRTVRWPLLLRVGYSQSRGNTNGGLSVSPSLDGYTQICPMMQPPTVMNGWTTDVAAEAASSR